MRRERHEQAFGTLTTGTLDALGDPLRIQYRAPGGEPIVSIWILMFKYKKIFWCLFVMRGPDCLHDGIDQGVRSIEVGSCSLQEEQML